MQALGAVVVKVARDESPGRACGAHQNFSETTDIGRIDPTLFLSVYLLLYPCLQWGLGGYTVETLQKLLNHGDTEENGLLEPRSVHLAEFRCAAMSSS